MMRDFIHTSESVTAGHPDKLCDQISDAIIDRFLAGDPFARVNAECAVATGTVFIAAQFATQVRLDPAAVAREVIREAGYRDPSFNAEACSVMMRLSELPAGERPAVDERRLDEAGIEALGADNIVTVFGYACRQTEGFLPLPIWLAHRLARRLAMVAGELDYLTPDGKTQIGVAFKDRRPERIHSVTLVAALDPAHRPSAQQLRADLIERVIEPMFAAEPLRPDARTEIFVNPGGELLVGGPARHAGLTGRKTAIDTYGEFARHSGAALSGKDPTRIDRIGAYAARHAAKNIVAAGLAEECEVQLSWTIGRARPVSVEIDTFGSGRLADDAIEARLVQAIDFRPAAIIGRFGLRHLPAAQGGRFYRNLAAYGHMGRTDLDLPWERLDRIDALSSF